MTFILVFNLKRVCFFSVTLWDPVRDLVRGIGDLHFSPKIAFFKGVAYVWFTFGTPLRSWLGVILTCFSVLNFF